MGYDRDYSDYRGRGDHWPCASRGCKQREHPCGSTGKTTRDLSIAGMYIQLTDICVLLQDLELTIERGSLVCVVGAVGAGKSR